MFMLNINSKNLSINNISYIIAIFFIIFFYLKYFIYLKYLFYTHNADSSLFVDLLYRIANFNSFNKSSIYSSSFYYYDYLTKDPAEFCSLKGLDNSREFNMYKVSHLYFHTWILSIPLRFGLEALTVSSFYIANCYFITVSIVIYVLWKNKISFLNCSLLLVIIFIFWKPIADSMFGQFYFDKFFIPLMTILIFIHQGLLLNNRKIFFIFLLSFLIILVHERAALMLAGYLITSEILDKIFKKKYLLNLKYIYLAIICTLYYILYIKFYQDSFYSGNISIPTGLYYFNEYIKFDSRIFYITNKYLLVSLPLILLSLFNFKLLVIAIGAMLPNIFFSVGGAEKIGFSTHYHTYYIPFVICAVVISFIHFTKEKNFLIKKSYIKIALIIILIFNASFLANDNKKNFEFKFLTLNSNFKNMILNSNENNLKNIKIFKNSFSKKIPTEKKTISMPEEIMPGFIKTNHRVDFFPIGVYKNDYLIIKKNTQKDGKKMIQFPYFLGLENYSKIEKCLSTYIKDNFKNLSSVIYKDSEYLIYQRLDF